MSINSKASPFTNPLCVALDVDSDEEALQIVDELHDIVGGFKLGPRLCLRYGQQLSQKISNKAPVFIDQKYFDIPSTMEAAVQASFDAGASVVTVHALSGSEALSRLAELESQLRKQRPFQILCVTILTSLEQKNLPLNLKSLEVKEHVRLMAEDVRKAGLNGLVCSAHELEFVDKGYFYTLTPGIRFDLQDHQDQKRVMSPQQALRKGASALVVGRPILQAKHRKEIAADFVMSLYEKK